MDAVADLTELTDDDCRALGDGLSRILATYRAWNLASFNFGILGGGPRARAWLPGGAESDEPVESRARLPQRCDVFRAHLRGGAHRRQPRGGGRRPTGRLLSRNADSPGGAVTPDRTGLTAAARPSPGAGGGRGVPRQRKSVSQSASQQVNNSERQPASQPFGQPITRGSHLSDLAPARPTARSRGESRPSGRAIVPPRPQTATPTRSADQTGPSAQGRRPISTPSPAPTADQKRAAREKPSQPRARPPHIASRDESRPIRARKRPRLPLRPPPHTKRGQNRPAGTSRAGRIDRSDGRPARPAARARNRPNLAPRPPHAAKPGRKSSHPGAQTSGPRPQTPTPSEAWTKTGLLALRAPHNPAPPGPQPCWPRPLWGHQTART